jgi:outer membrane receptor protein involved in Fe transport
LYSGNIELLDVTQIEIVRGAQGMLYGRNTVGGVIHVLSRSPNLSAWEGNLEGGYGRDDLWEGQIRLSGPLVRDKLGMSLEGGYASRDGFTVNDITGHVVDSRKAGFGKMQLQWFPTDAWSALSFSCSYFYNAANTESQDAYWLTNLRAGVNTAHWFAEAWVKNALDTKYVHVAFEYPNGQSGFLSESGAPLTVWLRIGHTF